MPLLETIDQHLKDSMRSQNKDRLMALRNIKAFLKNKLIEAKGQLSEEAGLQALSTLAKQRRESIEAYEKANRQDLVAKEKAELSVIQEFLPAALTEADLDKIIQEALKEAGAKGPQDMGAVMKALKPKVTGRADGKTVSARVQAALQALK
jgi:uncharacterized protein YqeY